jgi:RNA polymerase sigma-70 factor (ECF subfamily)
MTNEKEQKKQFLSLYEKHSDELFRYCFFKTGSREQSLEIVQEIFMKTWVGMQKGNVMDNAKAFLYASTRNAITDWYRKKKPVSLDELHEYGFDAPFENQPEETDRVEVERIIEKAQKLEEKYREVIILRFVNDLSVTEIAEMLGESENNISVRIHRALEKLRKIYIRK